MVDPLQAVALVEIRRLLCHPDRRGDADRAGDALADLSPQRRLDRNPDALWSQFHQVGRPGQVHGGFIDRHAEDVGAVPRHDRDQLVGHRAVAGWVRLRHRDRRPDRLRLEDPHAGPDAEVTRFPRRGHDGGGVGRVGGNGQGAVSQPGVVLLLDRGKSTVQIDHESRRVGPVEAQIRDTSHAEQMFAQFRGGRTLRAPSLCGVELGLNNE